MCGCTRPNPPDPLDPPASTAPPVPARAAFFFTSCQTATRSSGLPERDTSSRPSETSGRATFPAPPDPTLPPTNRGRHSSRYWRTAWRAGPPTGTSRCLLPFPVTVTTPSVGWKSRSRRSATSLARSPHAYISSSIARSRRCRGGGGRPFFGAPSCSARGDSTSRRIWRGDSTPGSLFHCVGRSKSLLGFSRIRPVDSSQRKKTRVVAK